MKFIVAMAAALASFMNPAFGAELKRDELLCGTRASMIEANRAIADGDVRWIKSLPDCMLVKAGTTIRLIECEGGVCKVRVWAPNGQSAVAYSRSRAF